MGSYEMFAWRDAMAIGELFASEDLDLPAAHRVFDAMSFEQCERIEVACGALLEDFLKRSESQRPSALRRIERTAGKEAAALFLVFAIIGLVRVRDLMGLRDSYRHALAPGAGNRETCASLYSFQQEVAALSDYAWPGELFDSIDQDSDDDDDDGDVERGSRSGGGAAALGRPDGNAERAVVALESMVKSDKEKAAQAREAARNPVQLFAVNYGASSEFELETASLRLVRSSAGEGGQKLYRLAHCAKGSAVMWLALFDKKPTDSHLVELLSRLRPKNPGARLGLPGTLKGVREATAAELGDAYGSVDMLAAPESRLPFTQWSDRLLMDIEVELALAREPNVTFTELKAFWTDGEWLRLEHADPKEAVRERGAFVRRSAIQILAARGRWVAPLPDLAVPERLLPDDEDYPSREQASLVRMVSSGRASEYGNALYEIVKATQKWLAAPNADQGLIGEIADRVIRLYRSDTSGRTDGVSISSVLGRYLGFYTTANALVDAAVLRRLEHPLPTSLLRPIQPERPSWQTYPDPSPREAPTTYLAAYWCLVESTPTQLGRLRSFPGAKFGDDGRRTAVATGELPEGAEVTVAANLRRFPDARSGQGSWHALLALLRRLYVHGDGGPPSKKQDWFIADEPSGDALYALVTVEAPSLESLAATVASWPRLAALLNQQEIAPLRKANLPGRLRFDRSLHGLIEICVKGDARRTLMVGGTWS